MPSTEKQIEDQYFLDRFQKVKNLIAAMTAENRLVKLHQDSLCVTRYATFLQ